MTDEQIIQHLYYEDSWRGSEWSGKSEDLLEFARAIHKESITSLTDVPNSEPNNRIVGGLL